MSSGDLLLFYHKWTLKSIFNKIMRNKNSNYSNYSHCAVVIDGFILDVDCEEDQLYVELKDFDKIIEDWDGSCYWIRLKTERDCDFYEKLSKTYETIHNNPNDILPVDWVKPDLDYIVNNNKQRKKKFWSSMLVMYIYTDLGLISKDASWTTITPKSLKLLENQLLKGVFSTESRLK